YYFDMKKNRKYEVKELIDPNTGETFPVNTISTENGDYDFSKIWIKNYLSAMDIISNKKIKIAHWIIENIDYKNEIYFTYDKLANELDISKTTVFETMKILIDEDFIIKKFPNIYQLNPAVIFKGSHNNRMYILHEYNKVPKKELTIEEKIRNLDKQIDDLINIRKKLNLEIEKEKLENKIKELEKIKNEKLSSETENEPRLF
ncbi:replication/maintenance protein RepL, partial [Mycoplasma sp. AC157]